MSVPGLPTQARAVEGDLQPPVRLHIPGLEQAPQLYLHGEQDQVVSRQIRERGIWEPFETSLLVSLLKPGAVFVDVGANLGYFSVLAASIVGSAGRVFAFEPDPGNFALLQANSRLNHCESQLSAVQAGLAAADGTGLLFLSEDNFGDHQVFAAGEDRRSVPITLVNGSRFLAGRLQRIDLLKIDVQGAEYAVMDGLMPLLQALPVPPRIILELSPLSLRQGGASGRALIELLGELGQPLLIIDHVEHRLVPSSVSELAQWCDDVDAVSGDAGFMNILIGEIE
jgi:FkbM family methyltransferase